MTEAQAIETLLGIRPAQAYEDSPHYKKCKAAIDFAIQCIREREELQRAMRKLVELAECQDDLLACYRLQRRPSERLLDRFSALKIATAQAAVLAAQAGQEGKNV